MSTSRPNTTHETPNTSPRWQPDGDAHLIYQWVKFEGKTQTWVASAFGVNQSTISRVLQRYERWQAHAKERENGRLDHAERLRAQRWLTYERNELIVDSCLRIAKQLEGSIDTSKSTILHHASDPNREIEVRTQHLSLDRTGMCSRFLRLAHRINMENLKLSAAMEPPAAEPLSPEELAAEEAQAAADAAELAAARRRSRLPDGTLSDEKTVRCAAPTDDPASREREPVQPIGEHESDHRRDIGQEPEHSHHESPAHQSAVTHNLHKTHNESLPEIAAITGQPCTCTLQAHVEKNATGVCITEPETPPELQQPPHSSRPLAAIAIQPPR